MDRTLWELQAALSSGPETGQETVEVVDAWLERPVTYAAKWDAMGTPGVSKSGFDSPVAVHIGHTECGSKSRAFMGKSKNAEVRRLAMRAESEGHYQTDTFSGQGVPGG